jgi:hypothetical protein
VRKDALHDGWVGDEGDHLTRAATAATFSVSRWFTWRLACSE